MNIYIEGHNISTPLREIVHALTGEPARVCEGEPQAGDWVKSTLKKEGEDLVVTTQICRENKVWQEEYRAAPYPQRTPSQQVGDAVKIGYYLLASKVYGVRLPWGTLTGIRPAKMAGEYLAQRNDRDWAVTQLKEHFFFSQEKAELAVGIALHQEKILKEQKGISIYVGIPFCPTRCLYCSFVSLPITKQKKFVQPYVDALIREIQITGEMLRDLHIPVDTLYIGGGTPTSITAEQLESILRSLERYMDLGGMREFTVEAGRPDTIDEEKLRIIAGCGVSRISINPQTLNDSVLAYIGRSHTTGDFFRAYELAQRCGMNNINTDLIAGLPTETNEMFFQSLKRLLQLSPQSVTVHTMCVKRASALKRSAEAMEDVAPDVAQMVSGAGDRLKASGYLPYYIYRQKDTLENLENTGFSKPGAECLYNIIMMEDRGSVVSLGAGSVSKIINKRQNRIQRVFNWKEPQEYVKNFSVAVERKQQVRKLLEESLT